MEKGRKSGREFDRFKKKSYKKKRKEEEERKKNTKMRIGRFRHKKTSFKKQFLLCDIFCSFVQDETQ